MEEVEAGKNPRDVGPTCSEFLAGKVKPGYQEAARVHWPTLRKTPQPPPTDQEGAQPEELKPTEPLSQQQAAGENTEGEHNTWALSQHPRNLYHWSPFDSWLLQSRSAQ